MSAESHQMPDVLDQLQRLTHLLDDEMRQMSTRSFTGSDETQTVDVTLDGRLFLVGLEIEEGLLRLGAETVEQRINEAVHKARAGAAEGFAAGHERLIDSISDIAEQMAESVGIQFQKLAKMGLVESPADSAGT